MEDNSTLSEVFKNARLAEGMTQQQVADKMGVARAQYAKYEHGTTPRKHTMQAVCTVLKLDIRDTE